MRLRPFFSLLALCLIAFAARAEDVASPVPAAAPRPAAGTTTSPAYVLTNTDQIRVTVYQEADLSVIGRIDSQGSINLPLVGQITVAGLKVSDAQASIEKAYQEGRYLRAPRVYVTVEEYAPREVSIQGQVRNPGRYSLPIESSMSILELVTKAGGFSDTAKGTAVKITRIRPDGTKQNFEVDVESLIKGRKGANVKDNSIILEAGDIVFVPERFI